jgi:hypothetical protein
MITEFHEHFLRREIKEDEKRSAIIFAIEGVCILTLFFYVLYLNKQLLQTKSAFEKKQITSISTTFNTQVTPTPTPYVQNSKTSLVSALPKSPLVKDYYVPLGTGTSNAFDWTAVPGAQVKLDFSSYAPITSVLLEASTFVPTGNESVSVRLYNVTDQHPVWNSEMTIDANTVDIKTSTPLIYDTGEKLYQVQMKTQLQAPANLTNSRIHIILK